MKTIKPDFIAGYMDNTLMICCPCGCDNVHHESTTIVRSGQDNYRAHPNVRGDAIQLPMNCEEGCTFTLNIGEHKGNVYFWVDNHILNALPIPQP